MKDHKRSVIVLALALLALAYASQKSPRKGVSLSEREERIEAQKRRIEAQKKHMQRLVDRGELLSRPDISAAWINIAHDRFAAPVGSCAVDVTDAGQTRFRGVKPQLIQDRKMGHALLLSGGDVADHWATGSLRLGKTGDTLRLFLAWRARDSDGTIISVDDPQGYWPAGSRKGDDPPQLSNEAMQVLARLMACGDPRFSFPKYLPRPLILDRRKMRYIGRPGWEQYRKDRDAFLDQLIDN